MTGTLLRGLAAGAVGTTALNAVSYLDMALRGRPASSDPERLVDAAADRAGVEVPGRGAQRDSRRTALAQLAGIGNGLGVGVLASVARSAGLRFSAGAGAVLAGAASMAATDVPLAALGVSDPRRWGASGWGTDVASHLAYGAGVQAVLEAVPTRRETGDPRGVAGAGLTARSVLLGVATGSRSSLGFAGPALTAPTAPGRRGRSSPGGRLLAAAGLAGELVADKHPDTPDRTSAQGLAPRLAGAVAGAGRLAARERANAALPAVGAVAGAVAGAYGGLAWRRWAVGRLPGWQAALLEDAAALALAAAACLPGRSRRALAVVPG
ncbi:hypothetical protein [Blastococcus sp. SYSU D00813]